MLIKQHEFVKIGAEQVERYTKFILKHRRTVIAFFIICAAVCAVLSIFVGVNYKFEDYLPDDAKSTHALDVMYEEYDQAIPNLRVLIYDVSIAEALEYKQKLAEVPGVEEINWLDDAVNIYEPLESADADILDTWYRDEDALYQITIDETDGAQVIASVRDIIGADNCMDGTAVSNALAPVNTSKRSRADYLICNPIDFCDSFFSPQHPGSNRCCLWLRLVLLFF